MEAIYFGNSTSWGKGSGSGPWVMLRVTDAQSQKMMYVYKNPTADWYLQLRPPTKSSDSPNTFQEDHTMLVDGPGRRPH